MLRFILVSTSLLGRCLAMISEYDFPAQNIIEKDVAILGGGGSGAYAAVRLREDCDLDIIVIEKSCRLGGHVDTYFDRTTNNSINYGVQVYTPYGPSKDIFARFNIETVPATTVMDLNTSTTTVDITNGHNLSDYRPPSLDDLTAALKAWLDVAKKYESAMAPGLWDFFAPRSIPSELLLSFGEFATKYGIEAISPTMARTANVGIGGFRNQDLSTWQVMAFAFGVPVTQAIIDVSFFIPKDAPNTILYDKIYERIHDDVMLDSQVVAADRNENGVRLVVQRRADGSKTLVKAKRLLVSFHPDLESLSPLQLDQQELDFFETLTPTWLFTSLLRIPFIPPHTNVDFISTAGVPDDYLSTRDTPVSFSLEPKNPPKAHLFEALLTTNYSITHDQAKAMILANIMKSVDAGTFNGTPDDVELLAFADHTSVLWRQPPEVVQAGLVQKALALQGHRSTWYTGGLLSNDYSAEVWALTDTVLSRMLEGIV